MNSFANVLAHKHALVYNADGFTMSKEPMRDLSRVGSLGFSLVSSVLLFTGMGYGVDRLLGTGPWLMVVGVFVGAGMGFYYMVRILTVGHNSSSAADEEGDSETESTTDDEKRHSGEQGGRVS